MRNKMWTDNTVEDTCDEGDVERWHLTMNSITVAVLFSLNKINEKKTSPPPTPICASALELEGKAREQVKAGQLSK